MNYNKLLFTMEAIFMKLYRKVLSIFLVCVFVMTFFTLTSCKFIGEEPSIEGTYKFNKFEYVEDGIKYTLKVGEEYMGMVTFTEDYYTITLNADHSAIVVSPEKTGEGAWIKKGEGKIMLVINEQTTIVSCDGKKIIVEQEGSKLTLKK